MLSSLFSKPDLLKTFTPLSESGKAYLEILLVNSKTNKPEGRGYFNDPDFLLEACRGLVGRYNFCMSNFAFNQAQIPTRAAYNQFDRALVESPAQEQARAHSFSIVMLFKPELIQEMTKPGTTHEQAMGFVYQIDSILGRIGVKSYSMDYFLTGVVLRIWAPAALQRRPLVKSSLALATKKLLDGLEKKMSPQEHKHFALTSAATGKIFDPTPGLPGIFVADAPDSMVVTSSGSLEPGDEGAIGALFEEMFEAKKPKAEKRTDDYAPPANIQGLSQNWTETQEPQYESSASAGLQRDKAYGAGTGESAAAQPREELRELVGWFQGYTQGKWRWPLYSSPFNKIHQGAGCGELLMMQCDPFAAELAFQFLMQSAEGYSKEGTGSVLVFSKRRNLGEVALAALSRHYRANPLAGKPAGGTPEAGTLAKAFDSLFPHPPQVMPCNRNDNLEQLLKYIEHDFLPKQRKRGATNLPLVILIDNLDEFGGGDSAETYRGLSLFKTRLRDFNASLWVQRMVLPEDGPKDPCLGLADYLMVLDHDGGREARLREVGNRSPKAAEWESGFHVELSVAKILQEMSLAKIRFQAHGSHRDFPGYYVYHRPSYQFREINPAPQGSAHAPPGAPVSQGLTPGQ